MKLSLKRDQLHYNNLYAELRMKFNVCASRIVHKLRHILKSRSVNLNSDPIDLHDTNFKFSFWKSSIWRLDNVLLKSRRAHANDKWSKHLIKSLTQSLNLYIYTKICMDNENIQMKLFLFKQLIRNFPKHLHFTSVFLESFSICFYLFLSDFISILHISTHLKNMQKKQQIDNFIDHSYKSFF